MSGVEVDHARAERAGDGHRALPAAARVLPDDGIQATGIEIEDGGVHGDLDPARRDLVPELSDGRRAVDGQQPLGVVERQLDAQPLLLEHVEVPADVGEARAEREALGHCLTSCGPRPRCIRGIERRSR